MRAQRVEVVQRRAVDLGRPAGHLVVAGRLRRGRQVTVPVVRTLDAHRGEHRRQRVDLTQEVLGGEAPLAQLLGQRVRGRRHRHAALDQRRQQARDQGGVARIVEFELVDAQQHVVRQQLDALHEPEHTRELGEFAERRERPLVVRRLTDRVVRRRQQVGLADTEPTVEVHPDAGQHLTLAEQLLLAGAARHGLFGELAARLHGRGLRRLPRVGAVGVEADVGERRRRNQLGDQPFRCDAGMSIDQMPDIAGPVHAGTITACCDFPYVRRR